MQGGTKGVLFSTSNHLGGGGGVQSEGKGTLPGGKGRKTAFVDRIRRNQNTLGVLFSSLRNVVPGKEGKSA